MELVRLSAAFLLLASASASFAITRPAAQINLPRVARRATQCWAMAEEPTPADESTSTDEPKAEEPNAAEEPKATAEDDLLGSAPFLKQKLNVLQKELQKVEEETSAVSAQVEEVSAEFGQKRTRLQTDFDNFRARHGSQTLEAQLEARVKLLSEFLPILDNFDRARATISPDGEDAEKVNKEYQALYEMIDDVLTKLDVTKIETVGTEFDYNIHMAIQQAPSDEFDEGIVSAEMQSGYMCKDKLLRPAYVMVSG